MGAFDDLVPRATVPIQFNTLVFLLFAALFLFAVFLGVICAQQLPLP